LGDVIVPSPVFSLWSGNLVLLLPQQIAPVDRQRQELTERCFGAIIDQLADFFLLLREATDKELAPAMPPAGGRPYPYGRCEEITRAVFGHLAIRLRAPPQRPVHPAEAAIRAFIGAGGGVRTIWGVLRGQYFQNAMQLGGLYVDVSNDTVDTAKPKVEILPLQDSGMEAIRDLEHFRRIAEIYWGAKVWANVLIPSLAPILPLVTASPGRLSPGLQSASDYMIALMCRDGFRQAEAWLQDAPAPPPEIAAAIVRGAPPELRAGNDGRQQAISACRTARQAGHDETGVWRDDRVRDFLRCAPIPDCG
jgi:hypothetical protein